MANVIYTGGQQYTLRASGPMPVYGDGSSDNIPRYVLHTFGADVSDVEIYECTDTLPSSDEFRGQGGNLLNASFSRLDERSGEIFTGRAVHYPTFENEEVFGFNGS